jgi:hypothetical protein
LVGNRPDVLQPLRLPECPNKASTLDASSPQQAPLRENDRPGQQAEDQQYQKNNFGDRTGFPYKVNNLSADEYS